MPVTVAVVGSGPSGFYTVDALIKSGGDYKIDVIERLPTPFGLIRGGVAPDHQKTKNVSRAYEKAALNDAVEYFGNVEIGRDLTLAELRERYDAVVLAIGSPTDRRLDIPGADKKNVLGAAEFVGWYNGHPDFRDLDPNLDTEAVSVIGNGNVAIDCARVLAKTDAEMSTTDLVDYASGAINASRLKDIYLFGRRGPVEAKFTNVELREMGELTAAAPVVDPEQLPGEVPDGLDDRDRRLKERNLATLQSFTDIDPEEKRRLVHFVFYANPVEVLGGDSVEGLRLERTKIENGRAIGSGEFFEVACGLVISAIGYYGLPIEGVPFDESAGTVISEDGRVEQGLYAVGWIKRGPTGVIGTNKHCGDTAARQIGEDFPSGSKPGREALKHLLESRGTRWISFADWQAIDGAERANAKPGAPRRKFVTIEDMLGSLGERLNSA